MNTKFQPVIQEIVSLVNNWEAILIELTESVLRERRNNQNRTIKQIVGHLVDSASNNTHRMIHLQYQDSPFDFPNYATHGNNDQWIAIQNYKEADWFNLVQLWKYINLHVAHVIANINSLKLQQQWNAGDGRTVSLEEMAIDYLRHLELHLSEINELINQ